MNTHTLFVREVQKWYRRFRGLRVTEVHDLHGIHYHWLVDTWMDVELVRHLGRKFGIGRVHAVEADRGAALYLAKYMSKKKQAPSIAKLSKWGTLGGFIPCRVRDIEITSPSSDRIKTACEDWRMLHGRRQIPHGEFLRIMRHCQLAGTPCAEQTRTDAT